MKDLQPTSTHHDMWIVEFYGHANVTIFIVADGHWQEAFFHASYKRLGKVWMQREIVHQCPDKIQATVL